MTVDIVGELNRIASALRNGGGVGHEIARIERLAASVRPLISETSAMTPADALDPVGRLTKWVASFDSPGFAELPISEREEDSPTFADLRAVLRRLEEVTRDFNAEAHHRITVATKLVEAEEREARFIQAIDAIRGLTKNRALYTRNEAALINSTFDTVLEHVAAAPRPDAGGAPSLADRAGAR